MDAELTRDTSSPTVTLLTGNELLGLFFRHFLGEQAQVEVSLAGLESAEHSGADLFLVDAGHTEAEQISSLIDQLDEQTPVRW